ncbi:MULTISPECIES: hypothetical protein [Acinetobacter]|nr:MULTISPECIES: hypothetical protein [Acinetobacter]EXR34096.1 hypothetical protein J689_0879 [Acinetobacter sp. 1179249]MBP1485720.1 hypothetical protein [Acinetobacter nosocomialis]MBP1496317.1 hypothetical protein [Acinetobacter nosocomialis]MBR7689346.1 hypothetical protein [Acinetobacter nosocomialis]MBR7728427.1 hypothetical protein [Acinetobacter nosocomialis]
MPKYLLLAEKISKNIKKEHSNNHLKNLHSLIMEIKKAINGTELKFLYNFFDFGGTFLNLQDELPFKLDISLIPIYKSEEDFIFWLADFIDRITIDTSKGDYSIKKKLAILHSIVEKIDL